MTTGVSTFKKIHSVSTNQTYAHWLTLRRMSLDRRVLTVFTRRWISPTCVTTWCGWCYLCWFLGRAQTDWGDTDLHQASSARTTSYLDSPSEVTQYLLWATEAKKKCCCKDCKWKNTNCFLTSSLTQNQEGVCAGPYTDRHGASVFFVWSPVVMENNLFCIKLASRDSWTKQNWHVKMRLLSLGLTSTTRDLKCTNVTAKRKSSLLPLHVT